MSEEATAVAEYSDATKTLGDQIAGMTLKKPSRSAITSRTFTASNRPPAAA